MPFLGTVAAVQITYRQTDRFLISRPFSSRILTGYLYRYGSSILMESVLRTDIPTRRSLSRNGHTVIVYTVEDDEFRAGLGCKYVD